jgi:hypothetical protein
MSAVLLAVLPRIVGPRDEVPEAAQLTCELDLAAGVGAVGLLYTCRRRVEAAVIAPTPG